MKGCDGVESEMSPLIGFIDQVVERCQWTLVLHHVNVSLGFVPHARWSRLTSIFQSRGLLPRPHHTARPKIMMWHCSWP